MFKQYIVIMVCGLAPPTDRLQGVQHKPGHFADRILRAVRPPLQLPENRDPCEERRSLPRQGGDDEGHGQWPETLNAVHRRSQLGWYEVFAAHFC